MSKRYFNSRAVFLAILLAILPACQTTTPKPAPSQKATSSNDLLFPSGPISQDAAVNSDPSASRLHDIGGMLLYYYAANKKLPDKLDDLKTYADFDQVADFTSPANGLPYLYYPNGIATPGHDKLIVVADPQPVRGVRFCVFMPPPRPGIALAIEVLPIPEGIFRGYQPGAQ